MAEEKAKPPKADAPPAAVTLCVQRLDATGGVLDAWAGVEAVVAGNGALRVERPPPGLERAAVRFAAECVLLDGKARRRVKAVKVDGGALLITPDGE